MKRDRRDFLRSMMAGTAVAAMGGVLLPGCTSAANPESDGKADAMPPAELKISFQEGTAPGGSLAEKFDYMEKLGVVGFEPGGGGLAGRVEEIQKALSGRNIKVSAICAGFGGWLLAEDEKVVQQCLDSGKEIIAAAGALGSVGMILVPGFNGQQPSLPHTRETRQRLLDLLRELGEFALQHKTSLILEPLNRGEAHYLRQVADAASLCRDAKSEGVRCMGDFWHMTREETSDMGAFLSGGKYLNHVHIASRKRRSMPGEDGEADNYVEGFKGLKMLGYTNYISFECGCQGDRNVVLPAAVQLIRDQWEKA